MPGNIVKYLIYEINNGQMRLDALKYQKLNITVRLLTVMQGPRAT